MLVQVLTVSTVYNKQWWKLFECREEKMRGNFWINFKIPLFSSFAFFNNVTLFEIINFQQSSFPKDLKG